MPFTPEELEEMRIADEKIERDFRAGKIKSDPLAEKYADIERAANTAKCREYVAKNREKINAYNRNYRLKNKERDREKKRDYARGYRAKIKEMYRDKKSASTAVTVKAATKKGFENALPQLYHRGGKKQVPYYETCPYCGANLDPGEICEDCREKPEPAAEPAKK